MGKKVHHPKISIIIAAGNYREFLSKFLTNIPNNFDSDIEYVFVVDSRDPESCIYNLFDELKVRYRVLIGNFGNPGPARNAGLEIAEGDWIVFQDIDDLPIISKMKSLVDECSTNRCEIGCGVFTTSSFQNDQVIETFTWSRDPLLDVAYRPGIWRMAFKRETIGPTRFINASMGEDQEFLVKIGFSKRKIHYSDLNVYTYRLNVPGQLTSQRHRVRDLRLVMKSEVDIYINEKSNIAKNFISQLVARQLVTMIKNGQIPPYRIKLCPILLRGVFRNQIRDRRKR